jgi:hypothetical protein
MENMKQHLKNIAAQVAETQFIRSVVVHLIYPTILRALHGEIRADINSPSGLIEAMSWKTHAYLTKSEELAGGKNCCPETSDSTWESREQLFQVVLDEIESMTGDIFEFGVSTGKSFLTLLERCPDRQVYGFDSWEGIPEDWWTRPKGSFSAEMPQFSNLNGHLVKGWYDETVPRFFSEWKGSIALLHIDCDLYSSTATVFQHALRHCHSGTVVVFDEYYNYPGFAEHEWRAWCQARTEWSITAKCIAYDGRRAAFRINEIAPMRIRA